MPVKSIVEALREGITEEMRRDSRVFCIGEDIGVEGGFGGAFTVTLDLWKEFGHDRILDTPISEAGLIGAAVGAAIMGMRPIADLQYGDFIFCAMDQVVNQAAKMRYMSGGKISVPMVLRAPVGITGRGAQHAQSMESFFIHVPGWKVVAPSTAYDAKGLLKAAVRDDNPVLIFEHKLLYGSKGARSEVGSMDIRSEVPDEDYIVPIGEGRIARAGSDVTVVSIHRVLYEALAAAGELEKEGISVEVIDPRTLVPLDKKMIFDSVRKTGHLLIAHEANLTGGWGAEVAALVSEECFDCLDGPVRRLCAPDTPPPFAPIMEKFYVPDRARIKQAIKEMLI